MTNRTYIFDNAVIEGSTLLEGTSRLLRENGTLGPPEFSNRIVERGCFGRNMALHDPTCAFFESVPQTLLIRSWR